MAKAPKKAGSPPKRKRTKKHAAKPKAQGPEKRDIDPGPAIQFDPEQAQQDAPSPSAAEPPQAAADVLDRLWTLIEDRKMADAKVSHSARLLARGTARVAQKLGEEAVECVIEAVAGSRTGLIGESADVLYHLLVAWVGAGIRPEEVWLELHRRERASHLGEAAGRRRVISRARASVGTAKIP